MAISVDSSYYYDVYMGKEYDDIDRCLKRAADIIDGMIIVPITTEPQIEAYKNAVCAEAGGTEGRGVYSGINPTVRINYPSDQAPAGA